MSAFGTIRMATDEDVPAIARLVNEAFLAEDFIVGDRTNAEQLRELMRKGTFFLLEEAGALIASIYTEVRGERGYFGMLAVEPSRQGTGCGRRMIEEVERRSKIAGCRMMDLKVLSPRTNLLPIYQKLGYEISGREEFHNTRPLKGVTECYCILMSKAL